MKHQNKSFVVYSNMEKRTTNQVNKFYQFQSKEASFFWLAMNYMGDYYTRRFEDLSFTLYMNEMNKTKISTNTKDEDYDRYQLKMGFKVQHWNQPIQMDVTMIHYSTGVLMIVDSMEKSIFPDLQIYLNVENQHSIIRTNEPYLKCIESHVAYLIEMIYQNGVLTEAYIGMDKQRTSCLDMLYKLRQDYHKGFNEGLLPVRKEEYDCLNDINTDLFDVYIHSLIDYKKKVSKSGKQKQKR